MSKNTRRLSYGEGGLKAISDQLHRDLPGLRGYSATQLNEMRRFYEAWQMLDAKDSSVATDKSGKQELSVTTDKLQIADNKIDIYHCIAIPNAIEFPIEDFFKMPFTHHTRLMAMCKDLEARYYYIHRTAQEHLSVDALEKLIKQQAYEHREEIPNNFSKALVNSSATYTTADDMPEDVRRALPDMEELKRVLNQETEKEKNRSVNQP